MKYQILDIDPPYTFSDKLKMSDVKRGADSQYNGVLSFNDLKNLNIKNIVADDACLALWVPSSFIEEGMELAKTWGFKQKQTWIWVKTKKDINKFIQKKIKNNELIDLNDLLAFGMGHLFRQVHEIALICARGKILKHIQNKSQISVHMSPLIKRTKDSSAHSAKPEGLQDKLDLMFPNSTKLELFARRDRPGWTCIGNECPSSYGEDIRDSLKRLSEL